MSHHAANSSATTNVGECQTMMLWNWQTKDSCFLSESWHVLDNGQFAISCIGAFLLVLVLEALRRLSKEYDAQIRRQFQRAVAASRLSARVASRNKAVRDCSTTVDDIGLGGLGDGRIPAFVTFRATPLQQLVRSVIHGLLFGIAYIVMLLVMSYNGYIIICIVAGSAFGKFLCDWMVVRVAVSTGEGDEDVVGVEEPSVCCG